MTESNWAGLITNRPQRAERAARSVLPQKPQGGGSHPVPVLAADAGRYWLKVLNNPQGPRVLINERVVGLCGELIGAPVCSIGLLRIPLDLAGFEFAPGRYLEEGIAHGSNDVRRAVLSRSLDHRAADENSIRHAGVFALCDWCWGSDLQWLFDTNDDMRTYSHDHGHYFPQGPNWTQASLRAHVADPKQPGLDRSGLSQPALEEAARRIEAVTREQLTAALSTVPESWPVTNEELETLGWFLEERGEGVAARLRAL